MSHSTADSARFFRGLIPTKCILWLYALGVCCSAVAAPDPAAALREQYAALGPQLRLSPFGNPLLLASAETPTRVSGDVYAVVDYPSDVVNGGLNNPQHWCEVLLLHVNTKYCHANVQPSSTTLTVYIGKKTPEDLGSASRVDFNYTALATPAHYLTVMLTAKDGPLGTSDYLIRFEAVEVPNGKTFLHLTYAYSVSFTGRLAMQAYLMTGGAGKVGFTSIGTLADGQPELIGGVRAVVERNTLRYYLAIDSFLAFVGAPEATQFEQRLQGWFSAIERYPRQLHDIDRADYVAMKRSEYLRQQTPR